MLRRLARIEGQAKGLAKMIEEERDCDEVLTQLLSLSGAVKGAVQQACENYMLRNLLEATGDKSEREEVAKEVTKILMLAMK